MKKVLIWSLVATVYMIGVAGFSWLAPNFLNGEAAVNQGYQEEKNMSTTFDAAKIKMGQEIYRKNSCTSCHAINGQGGTAGPDLAHTGSQRDSEWHKQHFKDPQSMVEGSIMPPYNFNEAELEAITEYMLSL
ncbi:MAG: cbb3-type cytochrome c oxidase subunit II [Bacillota bacterium]